jgi:hypothetical protein
MNTLRFYPMKCRGRRIFQDYVSTYAHSLQCELHRTALHWVKEYELEEPIARKQCIGVRTNTLAVWNSFN